MRFSANTGFLWPELPFLDRIRAAARAGFDAVEFHDEAQARADIEAAIRVADWVNAGAIHVLSGNTDAPEAAETLVSNLSYALAQTDRVVLIEPICRAANPAYFLHDLDQALGIQAQVNHPRLKLMFDCFHIETEHGDCAARFRDVAPHVGHAQIAGFPGRNEPDTGALDYRSLLPAMRAAGYSGAFGAEYRPRNGTDAGLGWMSALRT